jgi:hypothetical protein
MGDLVPHYITNLYTGDCSKTANVKGIPENIPSFTPCACGKLSKKVDYQSALSYFEVRRWTIVRRKFLWH